MSIRPIKLPQDLIKIAEIAGETWNYHENPEWNVQPDEEESLADSVKNYQKIWPFIRLIQFFSPALRDFMHGHVWEENGQIAGFTQLNRRGTTDTWYISAVGVHPDFRRRGIARQLVEAAIQLVRDRGGKRLLLDVIEGNVPAINLYTKLGFENFTSNFELEFEPTETTPAPTLPTGYTQEATDDYAWEARFALMNRITPETISAYEPVEEGRFKRPFFVRLLFPLLKRAEGIQMARYLIHTADGKTVAYALFDTRIRETGRNSMLINLDPSYAELARYLVKYNLHQITSIDPTRKIEIELPIWQESVIEAAKESGFEVRVKLLTLGLLL